jgi:hypothetical protein
VGADRFLPIHRPAKIEEFRDFWKTYYMPNNATLAVAGDFNVERRKKLIEEYFGPIPKGPTISGRRSLEARRARPAKDVLKDNTPLPATLHAWRAPIETDPDAYPLECSATSCRPAAARGFTSGSSRRSRSRWRSRRSPILLEKAGMLGVYVIGQQGVTLEQLDQLITRKSRR